MNPEFSLHENGGDPNLAKICLRSNFSGGGGGVRVG